MSAINNSQIETPAQGLVINAARATRIERLVAKREQKDARKTYHAVHCSELPP